jgi:hypothetical protein
LVNWWFQINVGENREWINEKQKRGKIGTLNTHIHERSLSLGICTAIKSGGVKLVLKP